MADFYLEEKKTIFHIQLKLMLYIKNFGSIFYIDKSLCFSENFKSIDDEKSK